MSYLVLLSVCKLVKNVRTDTDARMYHGGTDQDSLISYLQ
jgi:hypothetical protein